MVDYGRAIESNPSNATAYNNRGFAWRSGQRRTLVTRTLADSDAR